MQNLNLGSKMTVPEQEVLVGAKFRTRGAGWRWEVQNKRRWLAPRSSEQEVLVGTEKFRTRGTGWCREVQNQRRWLVPRSSEQEALVAWASIIKFLDTRGDEKAKSDEHKQTEKKHKKPVVVWMYTEKSNKGKEGENQWGKILKFS